jgi:hypothetical protein
MSYYEYSFNLKKVNSLNEFLFIIKNILRQTSKGNLYENIFNRRIHLSYSQDIQKYVYKENNSKKYILAEGCSVLASYLSNNNFLNGLEKLKIKNRENRVIEFECNKEILYPIALYNKENKSLVSTFKSIISIFDKPDCIIGNLNLQLENKNYLEYYTSFVKYLESNEFIKSNKNLLRQSNIQSLSYKRFEFINQNKLLPKENEKFYYMIYLTSAKLNEFINKELNFEQKNFYVYDNFTSKIIKLPNKFYKEDLRYKKEEFLKPIMPVSF